MSTAWGGAITGQFPSLKMRRTIEYASSIERDLLFFLEFDQAILRYQAHPTGVSQSLADGSIHRYTPDFLLDYVDEQVMVECKPADRLDHPHTRQQCQLGQQWAEANNVCFRLVTDAELREGHMLANLKLLWRYSRLGNPVPVMRSCRQVLSEVEALPLGELCTQLEKRVTASLPLVYHLLFHHHLWTDLHQSLTPDSIIRRGT